MRHDWQPDPDDAAGPFHAAAGAEGEWQEMGPADGRGQEGTLGTGAVGLRSVGLGSVGLQGGIGGVGGICTVANAVAEVH